MQWPVNVLCSYCLWCLRSIGCNRIVKVNSPTYRFACLQSAGWEGTPRLHPRLGILLQLCRLLWVLAGSASYYRSPRPFVQHCIQWLHPLTMGAAGRPAAAEPVSKFSDREHCTRLAAATKPAGSGPQLKWTRWEHQWQLVGHMLSSDCSLANDTQQSPFLELPAYKCVSESRCHLPDSEQLLFVYPQVHPSHNAGHLPSEQFPNWERPSTLLGAFGPHRGAGGAARLQLSGR